VLTDPYRSELPLHIYRIVGLVHDAEDLLKETVLAASRARAVRGTRAASCLALPDRDQSLARAYESRRSDHRPSSRSNLRVACQQTP
jgi:hypothetical protein